MCQSIRTQGLLIGFLIGCVFLSADVLMAQEYPNRPVRIIVASSPGAGADIVTRILAQRLTEAWGQQVVVDNRPGANGIIGAETAMIAKPDGYTLLGGVVSLLAINPAVYKKLPYDSLRDFMPISLLTTNYFALVVTPTLPAHSVAALVKLAKSRPNEMFYGTSGVGNQDHLAMVIFARAAGIKVDYVAYKGGTPALVDLVSGNVMMMLVAASTAAPHIESGKLRLLATAGTQRITAFPEAPTLVESGYPDVVILGHTGLLAPKGTPTGIINKVSRDIKVHFATAEVRSALSDKGRDITVSTPEEYGAFIRAEMKKWSAIVREVGLENSH